MDIAFTQVCDMATPNTCDYSGSFFTLIYFAVLFALFTVIFVSTYKVIKKLT